MERERVLERGTHIGPKKERERIRKRQRETQRERDRGSTDCDGHRASLCATILSQRGCVHLQRPVVKHQRKPEKCHIVSRCVRPTAAAGEGS